MATPAAEREAVWQLLKQMMAEGRLYLPGNTLSSLLCGYPRSGPSRSLPLPMRRTEEIVCRNVMAEAAKEPQPKPVTSHHFPNSD